MMPPALLRPLLVSTSLVLLASASPAIAQSTREQWLALQRNKEDERALAAAAAGNSSATRSNALLIVSLRFFPDANGRLVAVGEARNETAAALAYARLEFVFYDAAGSYLGSEQTYLHGGRNKLVTVHGLHTNVLDPGEVGFFKLWTTIPAASMASHVVVSAGEHYDVIFATSPVAFSLADFPRLVGQRYSGSVWQTPAGMARFSRIPSVAYFVKVAAATFQDGVITDVQVTDVTGAPFVTGCGESTTSTVFTSHDAQFAIDFERPVNSVRSAFEFEDNGIPLPLESYTIDWFGGARSFTVARRCGWTAVPNVPWIRVTQGAASSAHAGTVSFTVDASPALDAREGIIDVSGMLVLVRQPPRCPISISYFNSTSFFDPRMLMQSIGRFPPASVFIQPCSQVVSAGASWLRVNGAARVVLETGGIGALVVSAEPNTTAATRRGVVHVGHIAINVEQTPPSRDVDFNRDGWLDLLWHNQTSGLVSTWLMSGTQIVSGEPFARLFEPYRRTDTNWKIVGAADMDRDGWVDLVWQNSADGRLAFSTTLNISVQQERALSPDVVVDTAWKIKAVADFNQDGSPDLVWQHDANGGIAIWFMDGPTMRAGVPLGPGQVMDLGWKIVGSGDFNRDGWQDLVWQHQGDGRISVWKMRGSALLEGDLISPGQIFDLDWKIRGVGDINGDDMPDLIWQHRISGDVSTWLMNGTTMMAGIGIGRVPDTSWQIVGPR
jgi:hypothetical protein